LSKADIKDDDGEVQFAGLYSTLVLDAEEINILFPNDVTVVNICGAIKKGNNVSSPTLNLIFNPE